MLTAPARLHRADLSRVAGQAEADLLAGMRGFASSDASVFQGGLEALLSELIAGYGAAAAALGADWYDELREEAEVAGRFLSIVSDLPDAGRAQSLAGWAVEPLFGADPDPGAALQRASGGLQRIIFNADRQSVTASAVADPQAQGWQRTGSGECAFCRMLIGRGAVYSEATADFASHDHCRCVAVPAFGGQPLPVRPFTPSDRGTSERDRARVRAWLRQHPTG